MSGWILIVNRSKAFENQADKFKKVFSSQGLGSLQIEKTEIGKGNVFLSWAWTGGRVFPDLTVSLDDTKDQLIVIDGVVTDLGAYGQAETDRLMTAQKVLKLWNSKGKDILPELNGSFSIIIFSRISNETICVTDRIASRALWYSKEKDTLYFANFPSTIAAFRQEISLDGAGLWALLATSRPIADHGLFYEVRSLQARQVGWFNDSGKRTVTDWFQLRYQQEGGVSASEWGARIAAGLRESSQRIKKFSPFPLYLFLSGGLDSRIAAGVFGSAVKTLTLTTQPNMNSRLAERVARRLGIEHETIIRDPYYYLDSFPAAALLGGGNYNITHAHFIKPAKEITAAQGVVTFLLGDLLENFNKHYFKAGITKNLNNIQVEDLPAIFNRLYSYSHIPFNEVESFLIPAVARKCRQNWGDELVALGKKVNAVSGDTSDVLDALFRWYNNNFCPTNLMHECIKPFAEVRNLMYDNFMIDLVLRVPPSDKTRGILHRKILKCLDRGLPLIPDSNFWLPPIVPGGMNKLARKIRPILGNLRRKMISIRSGGNSPVAKTEGSWHMMHELFRKDPKYKDFIQNVLFDRQAIPGDILDSERIRCCWNDFQAGDVSKNFLINMFLTFGLIQRLLPTRGIKFD